jgi:hypothetical protein
MPGNLRQWLCALAATGLVAVGLSALAPARAHAATGIMQAGHFEVGNLLDYANSDFEGTTGDWAGVSNAALTDDAGHQFLHDFSLLDTAAAAGTSSFKLGTGSGAVQINMPTGPEFRVGAYFKAPAVSGQTVRFSLNCFMSDGTCVRHHVPDAAVLDRFRGLLPGPAARSDGDHGVPPGA